jgi:hypothetical protein
LSKKFAASATARWFSTRSRATCANWNRRRWTLFAGLPKASCARQNQRNSAAAMPWMPPCCRRCFPSPAAVRARPSRWTRLLPRRNVPANFARKSLALTVPAAQQAPSPVAKPTNSSVPHAPAPRDSAPLPVELETVAQLARMTAPAAQLAQVQPSLAPRVPLAARPGRKTIAPLVRPRVLPQAQPAKAVRPRTDPSLPNPHGRSRNAQIGQSKMHAQAAMPGRPTSAHWRLARKHPSVKRGFSTRTLAPSGRPTFT